MNKKDIQALIRHAAQYCDSRDLRFTDSRRFVLEIIASGKTPLGAYDVLAALGDYLTDPKPPTAYRAIEFLQKHGFIHRIESLNAYVACHAGHQHRGSQFLICDSCGSVSEAHLCSLPAPLETAAQKQGFKLGFWNAELHGLCGKCQ